MVAKGREGGELYFTFLAGTNEVYLASRIANQERNMWIFTSICSSNKCSLWRGDHDLTPTVVCARVCVIFCAGDERHYFLSRFFGVAAEHIDTFRTYIAPKRVTLDSKEHASYDHSKQSGSTTCSTLSNLSQTDLNILQDKKNDINVWGRNPQKLFG